MNFLCARELQLHPHTFPIYLSWNVLAKPIIIRVLYLNRGLKIHTKQFSNLRRQTLGLEAFNKYKLKQRTKVWRHTPHTQNATVLIQWNSALWKAICSSEDTHIIHSQVQHAHDHSGNSPSLHTVHWLSATI